MARQPRLAPGNLIFHVMNRANGRDQLFHSANDYRTFLRILDHCAHLESMRVLAYCAMPNHWHLLLWPHKDGDLTRFMHRLTVRHTMRVHLANDTIGRGHLYQARFKSLPVQDDRYLLAVCRYIETNPLRARLVPRASEWAWSSAVDHLPVGQTESLTCVRRMVALEPMPVALPADWARWLGEPLPEKELAMLRLHVASGAPFGTAEWAVEVATRLGIASTPRGRGCRKNVPGNVPTEHIV